MAGIQGRKPFPYRYAPAADPVGSLYVKAASGLFVPIAGGQGTAGQILTSNGDDAEPTFEDAPSVDGGGAVVQVVNTQTGAVATGTTTIPVDDTIPQNTEGTEFMSLAITPTSSSSKLRIDVVAFASLSAGNIWTIAALFQDSTANALAVGANFQTIGTAFAPISFTHYMTAGTTSATTFKLRIGPHSAATVTLNGQSGGRLWGGVIASSITITEITP